MAGGDFSRRWHIHLALCRGCSGVKIPPHSPLMDWVNTMAYAMVAGVLMLMLVYPTGILAASGLDDRLLGLVTGVAAMMLSKRIILSLLCGILMFAASLHLF